MKLQSKIADKNNVDLYCKNCAESDEPTKVPFKIGKPEEIYKQF